MSSWTERYLAAALRGIPDTKRPDLERELRSSISDAIDERLAAGDDPAMAERAALESLGDPTRLGAGYAESRSYLIGPELFPLYRAVLPRLLVLAVLGGSLVLAGLQLFSGGGVADAVLDVGGGLVNLAFQATFWGTLAFVVVERADAARPLREALLARLRRWRVENLPELPQPRVAVREVAAEITTVLVAFGAMVFLRSQSVPGENGPHTLFHGAFEAQWFAIVMLALVARGALQLVILAAGRWTAALAGVNALLHLLFALPIAMFALTGQLVDPYFAVVIGWPQLPDATGLPMLAVVAGLALATVRVVGRGFARAGAIGPLRSLFQAPSPSA